MDIKVKLPFTTVLALLMLLLIMPSAMAETKEVSSETGVYYTVKKGDTLWDLSQKFNDDPFTWPDLWSKNGQLANPHIIYPGQKLKLIRKRDIDMFGKSGMDGSMTATEDTAAPAESMARKPEVQYYDYAKINQTGFMTSEPITAHGEVFKLHGDDQIMLGTNGTIYIKANPDTPLVIGARYVSYRIIDPSDTRERLIGYNRKALERLMGNVSEQYYLSGVVEIQSKEGGYFIAKIVKAYRDIRVNDRIFPFKNRSRNIPVYKGLPSVEGEIIISEDGETTFGQTMTGFINRGLRDGIQMGQVYSVYFDETKESRELFGGTDLSVPIYVGKFIVLDTREETSTILSIYSKQEFKPGYYFRASK